MLPELSLNWGRMFVPAMPILEIFIRGSCMYVATFYLLRIFRRQAGSVGPADLLVLLLIADAAQNGMAGEYRSITEGIVLVTTIVFWEYLFDWLGYRFPALRPLFERQPLLLIANGAFQEQHLHRELLTEEELLAHLRQKGVNDMTQVRTCFLEGDGHISVITIADAQKSSPTDDRDNLH